MSELVTFGSTMELHDCPGCGPIYVVSLWMHDEDGQHTQYVVELFDPENVPVVRKAWRDEDKRKLLCLGAQFVRPEVYNPVDTGVSNA